MNTDKPTFETAHEVRRFVKGHGFPNIKVKYQSNPFGGNGLFFVELTDIPKGVCQVHSSGGGIPTTTAAFTKNGPDTDTTARIARLRDVLYGTANARCDH
jgi:hypothetical protein